MKMKMDASGQRRVAGQGDVGSASTGKATFLLGAMVAAGAMALLLQAASALAGDGDQLQASPAAKEPSAATASAAPSAAPAAAPSAAPAAVSKEDVAAMVKKLGDPSWRAREQAQKDLSSAGAPAVDELEKALKSDDAEVRQRAESILKTIRANLADAASEAAVRGRIWKSPVKEGVGSAAVSGGGVVCFLSLDGVLRAVDANTGRPEWTFEEVAKEGEGRNNGRVVILGSASSLPAPVIAGKLVYVSSRTGALYAVDLERGGAKWRSVSNDGFTPPAVAGGKVFAAGTEKDVTAFDAAGGKELWTCELDAGSSVRPAVSGGTVYVAAQDGCLYAIDANSGGKKKLAGDLENATDLVATEAGDLVVRTTKGLVCLGAADGKVKWTYDVPGNAMLGMGQVFVQAQQVNVANNVVVNRARGMTRLGGASETVLADGGTVYATAGGMLHAVDAASGKLQWTYKPENKDEAAGGAGGAAVMNVQVGGAIVMGGQGRVIMHGTGIGGGLSLPAVVGGTMYLAGPKGLYAVDLKTRQELWRLESKESVVARPAMEGGILYYGTADLAAGVAGGGHHDQRPAGGALSRRPM